MKTTKRIWLIICTLAIVCTMLFTFAGCGDDDKNESSDGTITKIAGKTPEELYNEAKTKLANLGEYTMTGKLTMDVSMEGESATVYMDTIQTYQNGNIYAKIDSDDEAFASSVCEYWGTEDRIYFSMPASGNYIIDQSMSEFLSSQGVTTYSDNYLLDLNSDFFSDAEITKSDDGTYVVKCNFDVTKYIDQLGESTLATLVESVGTESFKYVYYYIGFAEDGSLTYVNIEAEYSEEDYTLIVKNKTSLTTENVSIPALPEDAESWTVIDMY